LNFNVSSIDTFVDQWKIFKENPL